MEFREFMSKVPTCVGVITYSVDSRFGACTISSFISVDITPGNETALFALKKNSRTGSVISTGRQFVVNFLTESQFNIARNAGIQMNEMEVDSLVRSELAKSDGRVPVLRGIFGYCKLSLIKEVELGESVVYICKVLHSENMTTNEIKPLVYFAREFTTLVDG